MQSPEDVATAVGRNVRALRQQRRMTIDALAAAAGISRGTVIQIETARGNPSIATLVSLAAALRVGATQQHLDTGDTVLLQAHAPHRYSGIGDRPVRFVMVVLQPGDAGLVPPTSIAEAELPLP